MTVRTIKAMIEGCRPDVPRSTTTGSLEVTYASSDKEVMYFKDFNSRGDDPSVVDRARRTP